MSASHWDLHDFDSKTVNFYGFYLSTLDATISSASNLIPLNELLQLIDENFDKFHDEEKLESIMPVLHYTISLHDDREGILNICDEFIQRISIKATNSETVGLFLQFFHQILRTFQEISVNKINDQNLLGFGKIQNYLFSSVELVRIRSSFCAKILIDSFGCDGLMNSIWNRIFEGSEEQMENKLELICQLIDFFLQQKKVYENADFWKLMLDCLLSENANTKKRVLYILRRTVDFLSVAGTDHIKVDIEDYFYWDSSDTVDVAERLRSWEGFFVIFANLAEKQSHLILPSLELFSSVRKLLLFEDQLLLEILKHKNSLVIKWITNWILKSRTIDQLHEEVLVAFTSALNNTGLYGDYSECATAQLIGKFIESDLSKFLYGLVHIDWKSVPMCVTLRAVKNVLQCRPDHQISIGNSSVFEIARRIRHLQNREIRRYVLELFCFIFKRNVGLWSLTNFFQLIETTHNKDEQLNGDEFKILLAFLESNTTKAALSPSALNIILNTKSDCKNNWEYKLCKIFLSNNPTIGDLLKLISHPSLTKDAFEQIVDVIFKEFLPDINYKRNFVEDYKNFIEINFTKGGLLRFLSLYVFTHSPEIYREQNRQIISDDIIFHSIDCEFETFTTSEHETRLGIDISALKQSLIDTATTKCKDKKTIVTHIEVLIDKGGPKTLENIVYLLRNQKSMVSHDIPKLILKELKMVVKKTNFCYYNFCFQYLIEYVAAVMPDSLYKYVCDILESDPQNVLLASSIFHTLCYGQYDLKVYFSKNGYDLLTRGLLFGEPLYGDQKIEYDFISTNSTAKSCQIRGLCIQIIQRINYKNSEKIDFEEKRNFFGNFFKYLLTFSIDLNKKKKRYFDNSKQHRIKLRLAQAIASLQSIHPQWDDDLLVHIFDENNQSNITYIMELIIANIIPKHRLMDILLKASKCEYRSSSLPSIFAIAYMFTRKEKSSDFAMELVKIILPWTMGQNFQIRLYAQITIYKLIEHFKFECFSYLINTITDSFRQGDEESNYNKLNFDFRFNYLDYDKLLDLDTILDKIPRFTNMATDELYSKELCSTYKLVGWSDMPLILDENIHKLACLGIKHKLESEMELIVIDDVQRKVIPASFRQDLQFVFYNACHANQEREMESGNAIIVVASLIDKLPNLGGIARTCEVFGVDTLVLSSLRHVDQKEFGTLSMTAEKWLTISEVNVTKLQAYIHARKLEGYKVVGAEQTAHSISFVDFKFPHKSLLLLGHEKEGIPANLLSLLDFAVEIPQFGMVRSLNVHVTGALFIWEYRKQHLIK